MSIKSPYITESPVEFRITVEFNRLLSKIDEFLKKNMGGDIQKLLFRQREANQLLVRLEKFVSDINIDCIEYYQVRLRLDNAEINGLMEDVLTSPYESKVSKFKDRKSGHINTEKNKNVNTEKVSQINNLTWDGDIDAI